MTDFVSNDKNKNIFQKLDTLIKHYIYNGIREINFDEFDSKYKYKKILSVRNILPHKQGLLVSDYSSLTKTLDKVINLNKKFDGASFFSLLPVKSFPNLPKKEDEKIYTLRSDSHLPTYIYGVSPKERLNNSIIRDKLKNYISEIEDLPYGNIAKDQLPDIDTITNYIHEEIQPGNYLSSSRIDRKYPKREARYIAKDIHSAYEDIDKIKSNRKKYKKYENQYEILKKKFLEDQDTDKKKFIGLIDQYIENKSADIEGYFNLILKISPYPNTIKPKNIKLEYNKDEKILIISCELADFDKYEVKYNSSNKSINPTDLDSLLKPKVRKISKGSKFKYIKSGSNKFMRLKKTFVNLIKLKPISRSIHKKLAERCLYLVPIRMIHECFKFDISNNLNYIALNGVVESFNKSNGKLEKNNILSLFVDKKKMLKINIDKIDPKECFKSLKGVSAAKIYEYIPVTPILTFKKDKRVTKSKEILKDLNTEQNLAIMSWEDFEHLIRELFEKEFSQDGAEVKITQASRDKGVDAIAFDPDPIRGGKFIIQAKRYTSTVDVSAVRDLYGTIMNEGANRGILVSTAKYGGDSYEFIKNKPITLIEGNQLLGLLDKHGYKFKIDLKDARKILGLTEKTY